MTRRNLQKSFEGLDLKKKNRDLLLPGIMGTVIDGVEVVDVPTRSGFVYVRLRNNTSELIQAYNSEVSPVFGLPVLVFRDEIDITRYRVEGINLAEYKNWGTTSYVPEHDGQHSFNPDAGGSGDIVWVYGRQFVPSLVNPSGSAGAPGVLIQQYPYHWEGDWKFSGGTGTFDLTPPRPSGSNQALMLLLYTERATGNPLIVTGTVIFSSAITGSAAVMPYMPHPPSTDDIPLAGIRLTSGTVAIQWTNLYDVRPFYTSEGGAVSASGTFAVYDDSIFRGQVEGISFDDRLDVSVTGGIAYVSTSGSHGHTIQDDGITLPNQPFLNFVGDTFVVYDDGADTTIVSGTATGGGGLVTGTIDIYDDGVLVKADADKITFDENLDVSVSGSFVSVNAVQCGTYQRAGLATALDGISGTFWLVPDQVFASGSLSVAMNGVSQIPSIDYNEFIWVSGVYQYTEMPSTGSYHVVSYGVPCVVQAYEVTGTAPTEGLLDTESELLTDTEGEQLVDTEGE